MEPAADAVGEDGAADGKDDNDAAGGVGRERTTTRPPPLLLSPLSWLDGDEPGELGDMMVSMLPKNLAFTVFVSSPELFLRCPSSPAHCGCGGGAAAPLATGGGVGPGVSRLRISARRRLATSSHSPARWRGLPPLPFLPPARPAASPLSPTGGVGRLSRWLSQAWEDKKDDAADMQAPHFSSISLTRGTHILFLLEKCQCVATGLCYFNLIIIILFS